MSDEQKPKSEFGLLVENLLKEQAQALSRAAASDEEVELTDDAALEAEAAREAAAEQAARAEAEAAEAKAAEAAAAAALAAESTGFKPPAWEGDMQKMLQLALSGDDAALDEGLARLSKQYGVDLAQGATAVTAAQPDDQPAGTEPSAGADAAPTASGGVGGKR